MSFWEKYVSLCSENGASPNAVAKELNISSGSVTWWKKGKVPHFQTLQKIADYFGVTVDYLLGKEDAPITDASLSEKEKIMLNWFRSLSADEQDAILRVFVEKNGNR